MIKKKHIFEQRDHLGGHLKNTCSHVIDICTRIEDKIDECISKNNNTLDCLYDIWSDLEDLREWMKIPAKESYAYSPMNLYDDEVWWKYRKEDVRYIITKSDADEVSPTASDLRKNMLD